jgi:hypothetical protein
MNKYLLILLSCLSLSFSNAFAQADAEVATFESPSMPSFCPAMMPITINIYNNDLVDITELTLNWTLNSVQQLPVTWTGLLAAGEQVAIVLEPNYNFVGSTQYDIEVTIQTVNTLPDPNPANDIGTGSFWANDVFIPFFYWNGCALDCLNKSDYISIQWYKDGSPDPNAPDSGIYTPTQPGNYTMIGLTLDSCDAVADTIIFVNPPIYTITPIGLTEFCAGDSVGLSFSASEAVNFMLTTGSSLDTIYAAQDGWYTVTGTTVAAGCPFADSLHVTVHALPVVSISDMNDTLVSTYSGLHQWYLNGNQIGGAHDSTYVPTQSGIYYVTVTDVYGCVGTSNSINWIFPGIAIPVTVTEIMMYPNPARDVLNIKFNSANEHLQLEIYDISGRLVQSEEITGDKSINVSSLEEGAYNCVFKGEGKIFSQKLLKTF